MGITRHNAIIVTSYKSSAIDRALAKARDLRMTVLGPSEPVVNGYVTMLVCPDGSNEGWGDSNLGNSKRAAFIDWMKAHEFEDGSSSLDWIEVEYAGSGDTGPSIVASAWMDPFK